MTVIRRAFIAGNSNASDPSAIIARHDVVGVLVRRGVPRPLSPPGPRLGAPRGGVRAGAPPAADPRRCSTCAAGPAATRSPSPKRGWPPIGLDYSAPLLDLARRRDRHLFLVRGDMRSLPFSDGSFAAVVNFFTSFGYFLRESENVSVVAEIERVLRPGGAFLCDTFARDYVARAPGARGAPLLRRQGVPHPPLLERRRRAGSKRRSRSAARARPRSFARACAHTAPTSSSSSSEGAGLTRRGHVGRLRRGAGRRRLAAPDRPRAKARGARVIPFAKYPGLSPLFLDFLRGLPEFYPRSADTRRRGGARTAAARLGRPGPRSRLGLSPPGRRGGADGRGSRRRPRGRRRPPGTRSGSSPARSSR